MGKNEVTSLPIISNSDPVSSGSIFISLFEHLNSFSLGIILQFYGGLNVATMCIEVVFKIAIVAFLR